MSRRRRRRRASRRIVYLGGFVPDDDEGLSEHLTSRAEVAGALTVEGGPEVVWLGAAMIIGAGSTSFEMLRYVGDRFLALPLPRLGRRIRSTRSRSATCCITLSLRRIPSGCPQAPTTSPARRPPRTAICCAPMRAPGTHGGRVCPSAASTPGWCRWSPRSLCRCPVAWRLTWSNRSTTRCAPPTIVSRSPTGSSGRADSRSTMRSPRRCRQEARARSMPSPIHTILPTPIPAGQAATRSRMQQLASAVTPAHRPSGARARRIWCPAP